MESINSITIQIFLFDITLISEKAEQKFWPPRLLDGIGLMLCCTFIPLDSKETKAVNPKGNQP